MRFSVIRAKELNTDHHAVWVSLQRRTARLASPYFAPEFTMAVGEARDDVFVTVFEDGRETVGFFPFQRGRFGAGCPVGGPLSDYHGVVVEDATNWSVSSLLRESRLGYWRFDHLVVGQVPLARYETEWSVSPALDLSGGFAQYRSRRVSDGSRSIQQFERKARKLAREVGPLRFHAHRFDPEALACVFRWKSEQCLRTGVPDFFALAWTRELVERILATQTTHFSGALSTLHAGERLVAAHVGMRSARVWHWWFPVYDHAFARYSPGALLLLRVAEAAAESGLAMLDLGKGHDAYKETFADLEIPLASGCAARWSLAASVRHASQSAEKILRGSAIVAPARPALHRAKEWMRRRAYA